MSFGKLDFGALGSGKSSGVSYDAATVSWAAAVVTAGGSVSDGRKSVVDTLITGLEADGIWTKLDRLWILAAENAASALVDLKGLVSATAQAAPTFAADQGYTFVAGTSYLDTGFDPSTASSPQYTRNSAHFSIWNRSTTTGTVERLGGFLNNTGTASYTTIIADAADNNCTGLMNSAGVVSVGGANGGTSGFWLINKDASANLQFYKDNASKGTSTGDTSTAFVDPSPFYIGGVSLNGAIWLGCSSQLAAASIGASLDSTEEGNFYARLLTYMQAVGAA